MNLKLLIEQWGFAECKTLSGGQVFKPFMFGLAAESVQSLNKNDKTSLFRLWDPRS
jgi:hypothetical protein